MFMVNKRTGKKQNYDYTQKELEFQNAQSEWEKDIHNVKAWQTMFNLIQLACFNNINKKLEKVIPKPEIESKSIDITLNIMELILKKRKNNQDWKIKKVSSYVYLPCLAIYKKQTQFEDNLLLGENYFINKDTDEEFTQNQTYIQGGEYYGYEQY